MPESIAVLISDIHFSVGNLELASNALILAFEKARELHLPLIVAGDLSDTKAIIRAEVANAIISILQEYKDVHTAIIPGNHDLINQHSTEHSLNFLKPYCMVIDCPTDFILPSEYSVALIPYQPTVADFKSAVEKSQSKIIIAHQGIQTADMGAYFKDDSSMRPEDLSGLTVISGHYHMPQDIPLPDNGVWRYLGSPYTVTFAEANDGPKGFNILRDDGSLEHVPTNLRKHVIFEVTLKNLEDYLDVVVDNHLLRNDDLLWLKAKGPYSELEKLDKKEIGNRLLGHSNFKLEKCPIDSKPAHYDTEKLSNSEMFDTIIDGIGESDTYKSQLKELWRQLV